MTPDDITKQCREDWSPVVSHTIVIDTAIWQLGFDLIRHIWSLLNHFWSDQGLCHVNLHKWGLAKPLTCDCGQPQTINQAVNLTCVY